MVSSPSSVLPVLMLLAMDNTWKANARCIISIKQLVTGKDLTSSAIIPNAEKVLSQVFAFQVVVMTATMEKTVQPSSAIQA